MSASPVEAQRLPNLILLFGLFFFICFGFGYPTLNRYDPGKTLGAADAKTYCNMVTNTETERTDISHRFLVPWVAKPFYKLADGRVGTWNPILFGMLVANSLFTAGTAVLIVMIGALTGFSYATSIVGALLFLANFAVSNLLLAAYVDSGEAFFLALIAWSLLTGRWFLLPLLAVLGSLAKETFMPFALILLVIWWLLERPFRPAKLGWIASFALVAFITLTITLTHTHNHSFGPLGFAIEMNAFDEVGFGKALLACFTAREFWYIFVWLLPLGLFHVRRMDRRWYWATAAAFFFAVLCGAYNNASGNAARALFNISGPLLSLAAASSLMTRRDQNLT